MGAWDNYEARMNARGTTRREAALKREKRHITQKLPNSLAYRLATINDVQQELCVINSDSLDIKTILSMPGEDLTHGGTVFWEDNYWLVIQRDANNEIYTKGIMRQCNYKLKWIDKDKNIIERWCIVEDGTKYLTGEYGDNHFVLTRGDMRISVILPRDRDTVQLGRNNRFLIDDYESPTVAAYELSKPFKLGSVYGGNGVLAFVMQECNAQDSDNLDLHIANYYNYFPRTQPCELELPSEDAHEAETGRKGWI